MRRSAARPTINLTAYDLYLRARAAVFPMTKEQAIEALDFSSGNRPGSALRASAVLGGDLPYATRQRRLDRRAGDIPRNRH
jgi:hypothetical protein